MVDDTNRDSAAASPSSPSPDGAGGGPRENDDLRRSHAQLRALSARLQRAREDERSRVAREIHDELGQALTGLKLDLDWIVDGLPGDQRPLRRKLRELTRRVDETIRAVRRISTTLRPGVLDDLGLVAALEWQALEFHRRTGLQLRFRSSLRERALDPELSTAVFRIFQEALTNVARHARATNVAVRLEEAGGDLLLEVRDDGRGITEAECEDRGSLGLLGMRERAYMFGGELAVSPAGPGTAVTLRVPFGPGPEPATAPTTAGSAPAEASVR